MVRNRLANGTGLRHHRHFSLLPAIFLWIRAVLVPGACLQSPRERQEPSQCGERLGGVDLQKGWIYFYYTHRFPQPLCSSKKYGSPSWQLLLGVCKLRGRQVEQPMPAILALRKQEAGPKFEVSLDYKKRSFLKNK